jgi:outer membrane protein assembly factor BamA
VPQDETLLRRNQLVVTERSADREDLRAIIKQTPNKKILGQRFYLHMYNLPDPDRLLEKRARKDARMDKRNQRREARGKAPKDYRRTFGEWLRNSVGEPPVLIDPGETERSTQQLALFMQKEGWFRATVSDTIITEYRPLFGLLPSRPFSQPKADVQYTVVPGPMYRYRNIRFTVDDPGIEAHVRESWGNSLLRSGDRFDAEQLDRERNRIAERLKELGYLYFNRELISYDADTTVGEHQVDIVLRMERPHATRDRGLRGSPEGTVFHINNVTIATLPTLRRTQGPAPDTLMHNGYELLYRGRPPFKPHALLGAIFFKPNERFRQSHADRTYRRLTSLRVFDRVEISYDTTGIGRQGLANVRLDMLPGREQSMTLEGFGTNRGGFLGTSVSVGYRHRNLFRGMGSLHTQVIVGLEAQQSITGQGAATTEATTGNLATSGLFNTVDIGPEITLSFPHFLLPIRRDRFSRSASPRTAFNVLYNYQERPDFSRTLAKTSFGYEWNDTRTKTWGIFPLEINVIRIPVISNDFRTYLQQANDPVLTDSYTDHLIVGMRGVFTLNTQERPRDRNVFFARIIPEWAGHPMFVPLRALGKESQDTTGAEFFTVGGIRYAEFVKLDTDLRWRRIIHDRSSMAFRVAAGAGLPYGNLPVLPFESSFFVGGANGLRAWRARSLGPGSYNAPLVAFDRIGEIRLEGNAEYRFKLVGFLEGALFTDIGNIWNWDEDERKPGSGFSSAFLSELAVGTGVGARLNFDFFIVRFDLGMQTKDPSLPPGERWLFQPKDEYEALMLSTLGTPVPYRTQFNFNIGIGYPF